MAGFIWSIVSDAIGRKKTLIITMVLSATSIILAKAGDPMFGVYMNSLDNPKGSLIVEDSWFYGSKDDCIGKCQNVYVSIMRNTFSKIGGTGGEGINLKNDCYGDMAYNLSFGVATNGLKTSGDVGKTCMDYELFLLSRIREEHLAGKSNVESVATGLQRSARIITAAAVLLAVVFAAFVTSGVTSIKSMGFGVALAVILDATIVRGLLVPALMRLFGERNWWAPKWMQRFTLHH